MVDAKKTGEVVKDAVAKEIERSKNALRQVWGGEFADLVVEEAQKVANPPKTDLILAVGIGLIARDYQARIEELKGEVEALKARVL